MNLSQLSSAMRRVQIVTGDGGGYVSNDATYDALYTNYFATQTPSSTIYVRTTGNDTTGTGTSGNPYLTIGKGISMISTSGHLIVGDGTYDGPANWISSTQRTIPSGTSTNRTIIRAENRFGVRIRLTSEPAGYGDGPINLGASTSYVIVDGFICESTMTNLGVDSNLNSVVGIFGTHNKVTRCLGKLASCDEYGSIFAAGNTPDYNVIQDCHGFGSYRYMFYTGAGPTNTATGKTVWRRCTGYGPFGHTIQPAAIFNAYGADDVNYAGKSDIIWQNCFALASPNTTTATNYKYGDWLFPKSMRNLILRGCISAGGGAEFGMMGSDGGYPNNSWTATNCAVANANNGSAASVYAFRKSAGSGTFVISNYTITNHPNSNYIPPTDTTSSFGLTAGVTYPMISQSGNGADIRYAHGEFMTEYDEAGFDTLTSTRLWPLPYESYIKSLYSETITKPTGDYPLSPTSSVNPLDATALDGNPLSVTRYLFESGGNPMPSLVPYY